MNADDIFKTQYALVQSSREVLLRYLATLAPGKLTSPVHGFGHGTIRDFVVHIGNVYIFWLAHNAQQKQVPFFIGEQVNTADQFAAMYAKVDREVESFLHHFNGRMNDVLSITVSGRNNTIDTTPLTVFTHVVTHEYHHKGQILTMSRLLGYGPPDTDVIRF